jgi:hypothetical protein
VNEPVRAYKTLSDGRSAFTGWQWPLPVGDRPGEWVCAPGSLELCRNGIHASSIDQLPQWLGNEIWEAELEGEVLRTEPALVAARARLLRRVSDWDELARLAFCHDCAQRAQKLADRYPGGGVILERTVLPLSARGQAAAVGYWTALLSGESATGRRKGPEYDAAVARERAVQARWLRRELALDD